MEKTGEQRIPQRRTGCGRQSCPSDSEVLEEKRVKARFVSLDPFASREGGTDEGNGEWLLKAFAPDMSCIGGGRQRWARRSTNGRPYSRTTAARRGREKGQVLG